VPSARELLEQADALMRRNRTSTSGAGESMGAPVPEPPLADGRAEPALRAASVDADDEDDFPVLTEAVAPPVQASPPAAMAAADAPPVEASSEGAAAAEADGPGAQAAAPAVAPEPAMQADAASAIASASQVAMPAPAMPLDLEDVPVLTDAVEEIDAPSILDIVENDPSLWNAPLTGTHTEHPVTPAMVAAMAQPAARLVVETIDLMPPLEPEPPVADEGAGMTVGVYEAPPRADHVRHDAPADSAADRAARANDDARWGEMAEEIRMQVLQRIDLFTDTGLREQLAERLQPIVDRASADLVATINQHVGVILRTYVSEAIEREIERWRTERR